MPNDSALVALKTLAGDDAEFRDGQRQAIDALVDKRLPVLCVQRTGWGKSAVYFVATSLLRAQGAGPTLIISPLLALMRNQLQAAERLGLRARTINSSNRDDWTEIESELAAGSVDLLLISPERLNHPGFRKEVLPTFAKSVGLVVIDEAHCISDWGHDFRPDYRRVRDLLQALPPEVAVLCTTATANDRVVEDVHEQLRLLPKHDEVVTIRGALARDSLRLETLELASAADRLAWLAHFVPQFPSSGIVYCLTKRDVELVAEFLNNQGVSALSYAGDQDPELREQAEQALQTNAVKAVVATSALGMGYDKGDLGYVVHYQSPGSVIAYYQQAGRAGRAIDEAHAVLLRGSEDRAIQDYFIRSAFPPHATVEQVLERLALTEAPVSTQALLPYINLGKMRLEGLLKILDVEGAVAREGTGWLRADSDWHYDQVRYDNLTAQRKREQAAMLEFGRDGKCLMQTVAEHLDDPHAVACGRCSICTQPRFADTDDIPDQLKSQARILLRGQRSALPVKKQWPATATSKARRIPPELQLASLSCLARRGDGGWDEEVVSSLESGVVSDDLIDGLADRAHELVVGWVTIIPSTRRQALLVDTATRLAARLEQPFIDVVTRSVQRPPQSSMQNSSQQFVNLQGALVVLNEIPPEPVLLLDDTLASGWTMTMVGGQLAHRGSGPVHALALLQSD